MLNKFCNFLKKVWRCWKKWLDTWSLTKLTVQIGLVGYLIFGLYIVHRIIDSKPDQYYFILIFLGSIITALMTALGLIKRRTLLTIEKVYYNQKPDR